VRLTAAVFVALLALAAPALAQGPSPSPVVTVAFADEEGRVSLDDGGLFQATVTNAGSGGTPLDAQNVGEVTLAVTGAPDGWIVSVTPASFDLAPGESKAVEVQVSLEANSQAGAAEVTLTATMSSPLEGLDPILGPGGASQTSTGSDSIQLTRDDSATRKVLEAVGPWIYGILLLLVAAVLVAVAISLSSRRSLVRLSSDTRELTLPPGGRVAFPFQIEGLAKQDDAVLLQVSAVQEGWAAFLPVPEVRLAPGQIQEMTLVVIAPRNAGDGARQAVLVSATSAKAPKGAANLEFVATIHSGTPLRSERRPKA
jgi:uncharacterized membrane protein